MSPRRTTATTTYLPPPLEGTPAGEDGGGGFDAILEVTWDRSAKKSRAEPRRFGEYTEIWVTVKLVIFA
jgi:hypothetical protein